MDITRGELVEKELDQMIERRAQKGEVDPDEQEELISRLDTFATKKRKACQNSLK